MSALTIVPVDTAKALTVAYDARDAAIVRAQQLAAAVKDKRAELSALTAETLIAVEAVRRTTSAWKAASHDHATAVQGAAHALQFYCAAQLDDRTLDTLIAFDPNAV